MEDIVLKSRKRVNYSYGLVRDGMLVEVEMGLTPEEKKEFSSKLRAERDVVRIHFFNPLQR